MQAQQFDLPVAEQMVKKPDSFMLLMDKVQHMPPEAIGSVLDSYERFLKIQAKAEFDAAMAAFQKAVPPIVKSKVADMAGKYQYKYAPLDMCCEQLDPILEAHGLRYRWTTRRSDAGKEVAMVCVIKHIAGHEEETELPPSPHDTSGGKNPIQAIGSTLSYLQRYSLLMALGIAPKNADNDAGQPKQGGKMDKDERDDRLKRFDKCLSYQEVDEHYKHSYGEAHKAKDQEAMDLFIAAKKKAYVRLRGQQ